MTVVHCRVSADFNGAFPAIWRGYGSERATCRVAGQIKILIAGIPPPQVWEDPYLKEFSGCFRRGVKLRVLDPAAGRHILKFTSTDGAAIAHRILVVEFARNNVGKDFHRMVGMGSKPLSRCNGILVDDSQGLVASMIWVIVACKGKGMVSIEPAIIGMETVVCSANF